MSHRLLKTRSVAIVASIMLTFGVAGCSSGAPKEEPSGNAVKEAEKSASDKALDTYVQMEQEAIASDTSEYDDMYSDISIVADYPSGILFTYTYSEEMDAELTAEALDDVAEEMIVPVLETDVFPAMSEVGVDEPQSVTFTYLNSDGSEIWSRTFTSE